jgi:N-acetylglutamate synthase-like GNAT family acetyltransferase
VATDIQRQHEMRHGNVRITTDPREIDTDAVLDLLRTTHWASQLPRAVLERAMQHSIAFAVLENDTLVGFARVVTDYATFAHLCDVVIESSHRGRGLGKWLVESIMAHPALQGLRRISLVTRDAPWLYEPFGFTTNIGASSFMERLRPFGS